MTTTIPTQLIPYAPDKSDRPLRLYTALAPHIHETASIIDIGCGIAPLAGYIRDNHPTATYHGFDSWSAAVTYAREQYPWADIRQLKWVIGSKVLLDRVCPCKFDIAIHIGIDSWLWADIYHIHEAMLKAKRGPDVVMLEAGERAGYPYLLQSLVKVRNVYRKAKYEMVDYGEFPFTAEGNRAPQRYYCVMRRGK